LADGSFRFEDVLPGQFRFRLHLLRSDPGAVMPSLFTAEQELVVPDAGEKDNEAPVEWGEVQLRKFTFPTAEGGTAAR